MSKKNEKKEKGIEGEELMEESFDDTQDKEEARLNDEVGQVQIPPSLEDEAEKPTKLPGKTRAGSKESYRPFHKK